MTNSGGVKCWGRNFYGQLGDGTSTDRSVPTNVSGLTSGVSAVSAGLGSQTCIVTTGGAVKCWGFNFQGILGDGTVTNRNTPTNVSGLTSNFAAVSAGGQHTCAKSIDGGLVCWGSNFAGNLGDNTVIERRTPVSVSGLVAGVVTISADGSHTCASTNGLVTKCWGYNFYGQLGDGTTTDRSMTTNILDNLGNQVPGRRGRS